MEEGSCSSDAYTESEDDDVDKEYSTDNDIHDDDGSYDSGEDDIEEDLDYSDDSEHEINANVKDGKVLHWSLYWFQNIIDEIFSMLALEGPSRQMLAFFSLSWYDSCFNVLYFIISISEVTLFFFLLACID